MAIRLGVEMFLFANPDATAPPHQSADNASPDANDSGCHTTHRSIAQGRVTAARRSFPARDWIDFGMVF
jgi:hypothetical protein